MPLGDEIDELFRREVKSLPAYAKAQAAGGSGVAPPVDEMNELLIVSPPRQPNRGGGEAPNAVSLGTAHPQRPPS